jgi:hypothetical protein
VASPGASLPRRVRYSPVPPINCTGRGCQTTIMLLSPPRPRTRRRLFSTSTPASCRRATKPPTNPPSSVAANSLHDGRQLSSGRSAPAAMWISRILTTIATPPRGRSLDPRQPHGSDPGARPAVALPSAQRRPWALPSALRVHSHSPRFTNVPGRALPRSRLPRSLLR